MHPNVIQAHGPTLGLLLIPKLLVHTFVIGMFGGGARHGDWPVPTGVN
jgi:hypothetical protein